ncbi:MAG: chemotaxis protein CheW [Cyanobacteria bacterium J06631_6]
MVIDQEYFAVELASEIVLGLPLNEMTTVAQFEIQNICPVPGVASFWYGVVSFKGSLLWILDSHRFFDLQPKRQKLPQKLTTVIVKNRLSSSNKQVAIATQQLRGIVAVAPANFKPLSERASPQLRLCCSTMAYTETQNLHIVDSAALLQQLHQQSMLVST